MPALNPNVTPRWRIRYNTLATPHVMLVRALGDASDGPAVGSAVGALFNTLSPILVSTTLIGADFAAAGSDVFLPVSIGIEGDTYGGGGQSGMDVPKFLAFVGRDVNGHRARLSVYGLKLSDDSYRITVAEDAAVSAAIDLLNSEEGVFYSIGGSKPVWKPYANMGFNAYWQRKRRRG